MFECRKCFTLPDQSKVVFLTFGVWDQPNAVFLTFGVVWVSTITWANANVGFQKVSVAFFEWKHKT